MIQKSFTHFTLLYKTFVLNHLRMFRFWSKILCLNSSRSLCLMARCTCLCQLLLRLVKCVPWITFKIVNLNLFLILCITDLPDKTKVSCTDLAYKYFIDTGNNNTRRSGWSRGLLPLSCCECGFKSRHGHGCLSVVTCVLSGKCLSVELITRSEESCRPWCDRVTSWTRPGPSWGGVSNHDEKYL